MLSLINSELIRQSQSYEAAHRRDYNPFPQNEQFILDTVAFICITLDTFICSTIVSLIYFPEHMSTIQNASLGILFALRLGRVFGEFLYQLQQHRAFVNTRKQFQVRVWDDPTAIDVCILVWQDPHSLFDFRTHMVRIGRRYIVSTPSYTETPDVRVERNVPNREHVQQQQHPYNTRSQARLRTE